jgi:N-acetylmuramoyl-L-alanine amidase
LLMQLLGSPNHRLVNPFFHNQIKRRIAMITSSQKTSYQYLRKVLVLPVAAVITALFAFKYKTVESIVYLKKPIIVIIDAGHGNNSGATAPDGTKESTLTLSLAKKIKSLNQNDQINILLTRESEKDVTLQVRGAFTNYNKADLFISLHANMDNSSDKSGFEFFVTRKNKKYYAENQILGAIFLNYFMNTYKTDNEIKQREEGIWVLDQPDCPAILVECGYLSNQKDLAYVKNPDNQDKIARSILQSIEQFSIQKDMPDFEERKQKFSDTLKPDIKVVRKNDGEIYATVDQKKIAGVLIDSAKKSLGFLLENKSMLVINGSYANFTQHDSLWQEFINSHPLKNYPFAIEDKTSSTNQEKVFEKVEVDAMFPGGDVAFTKFAERFMNGKVGVEHKAPQGAYTVWTQFIVNKDGSIREIKSLTKHGYGMEEEAAKIIRKGPKWTPAMQNGRKVSSYRKVKVDFFVGNDS